MSEEDDTCLTCCMFSCGCIFIYAFAAASVAYYVFGIMYLVQDYDVAHDCDDSELWAYVLVALIFGFLNGSSVAGRDEDGAVNFCFVSVLTAFNFAMSTWGGIELFLKSCSDLEKSNLHIFATVVFAQYTAVSGILLAILLVGIYGIAKENCNCNLWNCNFCASKETTREDTDDLSLNELEFV